MITGKDYPYGTIINILKEWEQKYPFITLKKIGISVLGRPIYAIEIGKGNQSVCFCGGFHGSERLTVTSLLMFTENLCKAVDEKGDFFGVPAYKMLFSRTCLIVPCVNPDGYEIARVGPSSAGILKDRVIKISNGEDFKFWNANARGIDINHNFDAGFSALKKQERMRGIFSPAPRYFGGDFCESEPETVAIADYIRQNQIINLLCFHSQGEEIFNDFCGKIPPRSAFLTNQFCAATGYSIAKAEGTASYGGCKDWFIKTYNRPAFTFEIGKGENPLPSDSLYDIYSKIEPVFLIACSL